MDVKDYFEYKKLKYNPGKNQTIATQEKSHSDCFL